jgi:carboxylesterase type B
MYHDFLFHFFIFSNRARWYSYKMPCVAGPVCIQDLADAKKTHFPFPFPENMSEDCLFLNIWTPTLDKEARLPVMMYIHGGSFIIGKTDH